MEDYKWNEQISPCPPHPMEEPGEINFFTYGGVIQMDKDITTFTPDFYETIGLDNERWSIVGLNISPTSGKQLVEEWGRDDMVRVYAVDREQLFPEKNKPGGLTEDAEPIEVVEFYCHDIGLEDILKCMKTTRISMKSRHLRDREITVTGLADIPVQEEP